MSINTETLKSIRDEAFEKAQSMELNNTNEMYRIKSYYLLSYAVEKILKVTTVRIRPVVEFPSPSESKEVQKA